MLKPLKPLLQTMLLILFVSGPAYTFASNNSIAPLISLMLLSCDADGVELPGNKKDDDCDGLIDELFTPCDTNLSVFNTDAENAASAMDLCQESVGENWGVIETSYERAPETRKYVVEILGIIDDESVVPDIAEMIKDTNLEVQKSAIYALSLKTSAVAKETLLTTYKEGNEALYVETTKALLQHGVPLDNLLYVYPQCW